MTIKEVLEQTEEEVLKAKMAERKKRKLESMLIDADIFAESFEYANKDEKILLAKVVFEALRWGRNI